MSKILIEAAKVGAGVAIGFCGRHFGGKAVKKIRARRETRRAEAAAAAPKEEKTDTKKS